VDVTPWTGRPTYRSEVWGLRGPVCGRSSSSYRRSCDTLNAVDYAKCHAPLRMITLTGPASWSRPDKVKVDRCVDRFQKRLARRYPDWGGYRALEPQRRGAPHFHLLPLEPRYGCDGVTERSRASYREVATWVAAAWAGIVFDVFGFAGSPKGAHRKWGAKLTTLSSVNEAVRYIAKSAAYVSKRGGHWKDDGDWGYRGLRLVAFGRGNIPRDPVFAKAVTPEEHRLFCRALRGWQWAQRRGAASKDPQRRAVQLRGAKRFLRRYARNGGGKVNFIAPHQVLELLLGVMGMAASEAAAAAAQGPLAAGRGPPLQLVLLAEAA